MSDFALAMIAHAHGAGTALSAAIARAERAEAALAVAEEALISARADIIRMCDIYENIRDDAVTVPNLDAALAKIAAPKGGVEPTSTPQQEGGAA